jgi:hypothetical protein
LVLFKIEDNNEQHLEEVRTILRSIHARLEFEDIYGEKQPVVERDFLKKNN